MLGSFAKDKTHLGFFEFPCCYPITSKREIEPLMTLLNVTFSSYLGGAPLPSENLQRLKQLCDGEKNKTIYPNWAKQIYSVISFWVDYEECGIYELAENKYCMIRFLWEMHVLGNKNPNETIINLEHRARFITRENFEVLNKTFINFKKKSQSLWKIGYDHMREACYELTQEAEDQLYGNKEKMQGELVVRLKKFITNRDNIPLDIWGQFVDVPVSALEKMGDLNPTTNLKKISSVLSLEYLHQILPYLTPLEPEAVFYSLLNVIIRLRYEMKQRLHAVQMSQRNLDSNVWSQSNIVGLKLLYDQTFRETDDWCEKYAQYLDLDDYEHCEANNTSLERTRADLERIDNMRISLVRDGELQPEKIFEISMNTVNKFDIFFNGLKDYGLPESLLNFLKFNFHQNGFTHNSSLALEEEVHEIRDNCIIRQNPKSRSVIMTVLEDQGEWKIRLHLHYGYDELLASTFEEVPRQELNTEITVEHIFEIRADLNGTVSLKTILYSPMTDLLQEAVRNVSFDEERIEDINVPPQGSLNAGLRRRH